MMRTTGGHYPQGLDNGVLRSMSSERPKGKFAKLVAEGESPTGLMVQTPNGTSRQDKRQEGRAYQMNTDRWTSNEPFDGDMSGI